MNNSFGTSSYGTSQYGLGSVDYIAPKKNVFSGYRKIDPETQRFVIDPTTGQPESMTLAQELVYNALTTLKQSATVKSLGAEFNRLQLISPGIEYKAQVIVNDALKQAIEKNIVSLTSIKTTSEPSTNRAQIDIIWTDLKSSQNYTSSIGL